jgi:LysM repeat protein
VKRHIALVLALVTMLAMVATPVALADENEAGWWGNIVGFPFPGSAICITALDGSMINNCHGQYPLRGYEPIKFDGVQPKMYMVTSGPAKAFLFAQPGVDNIIDWAWGVPGWWHPGLPTPTAPGWHMWSPDGTMKEPPTVTVNVSQAVNVNGSGAVAQTVDVNSPIATKVHVDQSTVMKAVVPAKGMDAKDAKNKCFCYTVKSGDSLSKIAVKYHDTVMGLVSRNNIKNVNKVFIGQRITVCDP